MANSISLVKETYLYNIELMPKSNYKFIDRKSMYIISNIKIMSFTVN